MPLDLALVFDRGVMEANFVGQTAAGQAREIAIMLGRRRFCVGADPTQSQLFLATQL